MAEAEPSIRYTTRSGQAVVEVGGSWTVFTLRGIRQKASKALRAARGQQAPVVDAKGLQRLDTSGALEILELTGSGPQTRIEARDKAHAELFDLVQKNMCVARPERRVNWFAHWLGEVGHN